jgi:hypothetical protein
MLASTLEKRLAADIRRTTTEEREDLLAFRSRMYGPRSAFADPAWVRWLYDDVPTRKERPALWVYRRAGEIHGQIGAILTRVRVGDDERELAWTLDLMVSPEHRLRGPGAVLHKIAGDTYPLIGGTEVSDAARRTFTRAGWRDHGTLPRWVRPVRGAFLRTRTDTTLASVLGPALGAAALAVSALGAVRARGRRLVPITAFDERADHVWRTAGPHWPVIARRDRAWLAWRWDACPDRRGARAFVMERDGEPVGWVVLRVGDERGMRAGFILDLLCAPDELPALIALAVDLLRSEEVDVVYCLLRAPGAEEALVSNGFIGRDSGLRMMTLAAECVPQRVERLVGDHESWFVTSADSDLDRRREGTVFA